MTDPSAPPARLDRPPPKKLVGSLTYRLVDFQKKREILFEKWGVMCCIDV